MNNLDAGLQRLMERARTKEEVVMLNKNISMFEDLYEKKYKNRTVDFGDRYFVLSQGLTAYWRSAKEILQFAERNYIFLDRPHDKVATMILGIYNSYRSIMVA